jgi:hypothetical protein
MGIGERVKHELKALAVAGLYFTLWLGALVVLKKLILSEYRIEFQGLSVALMGALVLSKVVLILEKVSFGSWVRRRGAWVDVALRTLLYVSGTAVVLMIEKAFEGRHEYGGFVSSLKTLFDHADINHVWLNVLCLGGALLGYNVLWVVRRHLGEGGLLRLLLAPLPEEPASVS